MTPFDYKQHRVFGVVEKIPASYNSHMHVIGYCDMFSSNKQYMTLDLSQNIFGKNNRIFANMFAQKHSELLGHCVSIAVMPSEKTGENLDYYVWDWDIEVIDLASPVIKITPDVISNDGNINYEILSKHNLINTEFDTYFESNGCVYLIKAHSIERMLSYWTFSDLEVKCREAVVFHAGKLYIIDHLCEKTGVIDITTDTQLIDWFCKKILKSNWTDFINNHDFYKIESTIKDVLLSVKLDSNIFNSRLKRLKTICTNVQLSLDNLENISKNPWFSDIVQNSIARFKENFISETETANNEELKRLKEEHEQSIASEKDRYINAIKIYSEEYYNKKEECDLELEKIKRNISESSAKLIEIEENINKKKTELVEEEKKWKTIIEKKDSIISEFQVIRDVISISNKVDSYSIASKPIKFHVHNTENSPAELIQVFMKRLEDILKAYGAEESNAENTTNLLCCYNIIASNDARVIKAIIHATGYCSYTYQYVNPKWTNFNDLWENGLMQIVMQAEQNPDIIHYLVLRNMNLSYIPSYMQPIFDIQFGGCDTIYSTDYVFPKNLRIIGHISDDSLIPVNIYAIEDIGCMKKIRLIKKDVNVSDLELARGYLTPSLLNNREHINREPTNHFEDYLSLDE